MATLAQSLPESPRPLVWFWEFLKEELASNPGRVALVARMIIASTLVMLITMTFRIPYGAYGTIYALTISRESPQATVNTARTIIVAFVLGGGYVLLGALFFLDDPKLRLLWVIGSLFISFYALSAMTNYGAAARFGYLIIITTPLWDRHIPAELKVEGTLWAVWAITIASMVTVLVELVFAKMTPGDDLVRSLAERLDCVEEVLTSYLADRPVDPATGKNVTRLAVLGVSRLRRFLRRSTYSRAYREQMSAVVALVGRLVDIAANLTQLSIPFSADKQQRIRALTASIATIRADLLSRRAPTLIDFDTESKVHGGVPLLREMERTVALIPVVFSGSGSISEYVPSPSGGEQRSRIFVSDALSNPEHVKFGLRGGLAASLCYLVYTSIAWPEISTAVTTCLLTALSTIGSSRQKQFLRFAGAVVGGVLVGMGSQIFILPYFDSIAGFTVLFLLVTVMGAWLATSGPRFSYFGVQLFVAFYLINLQEFKIQTSLAVARDRVAGIMLGLLMMWLVYDQLWGAPAAIEMKRTFISNLRSLAQLVREPLPGEKELAIERTYSLRETISTNFDKVRTLADAVLFEFSSSRQQDLASRNQIRHWRPRLRTLFVTQIALLKYRLQLPGFELPEAVRVAQRDLDDELAKMLEDMANRMEDKVPEGRNNLKSLFGSLEQTVRTCCSEGPQQLLPIELQTFLGLSRNMESLTTSLDKEI
jgi:multidrug resistance protein MdtO